MICANNVLKFYPKRIELSREGFDSTDFYTIILKYIRTRINNSTFIGFFLHDLIFLKNRNLTFVNILIKLFTVSFLVFVRDIFCLIVLFMTLISRCQIFVVLLENFVLVVILLNNVFHCFFRL